MSGALEPTGTDERRPDVLVRRSTQLARGRGLSRRQLLRASLLAGIGVWVAELAGGTIAFLWGAASSAAVKVRIGTRDDLIAANSGLPVAEGFPAYVPEARAFVMTIDPDRGARARGSAAAIPAHRPRRVNCSRTARQPGRVRSDRIGPTGREGAMSRVCRSGRRVARDAAAR